MITIAGVRPGSAGEEIGLEGGDHILSVNSRAVNDSIDFTYYAAQLDDDGCVNLRVRKKDGTLLDIDAEIDGADDLGLDLPPIEAKSCKNKCIFCFVHQLPKGLRRTLYVKDEDYRLSFLEGNYVTMAKISRAEIERIKEQHLSPIYISVHSTDPEMREKLLGVRPDHDITALMEELAASGIRMHAQIVVCPGLNDGEDLKCSIKRLYKLSPSLISLSVVPVGLTSHRDRLTSLRPVEKEDAVKTIAQVTLLQDAFRGSGGSAFVFLADEYYLKAGAEFPSYDHYEDFPQLGNGVGLITSFKEEAEAIFQQPVCLGRPLRASVVTGLSPLSYIEAFVDELNRRTGARIRVYGIENRLLGETVTVTGLISGGDIIEQLKDADLGDLLMIPDIAMRDGDGSFLDDLTAEDVAKALGLKVVTFESSPAGFMEKIAA